MLFVCLCANKFISRGLPCSILLRTRVKPSVVTGKYMHVTCVAKLIVINLASLIELASISKYAILLSHTWHSVDLNHVHAFPFTRKGCVIVSMALQVSSLRTISLNGII